MYTRREFGMLALAAGLVRLKPDTTVEGAAVEGATVDGAAVEGAAVNGVIVGAGGINSPVNGVHLRPKRIGNEVPEDDPSTDGEHRDGNRRKRR